MSVTQAITSTRLKREPLYSQASDLGDPQIATDSAVPKSESSVSSETSSKICGTLNQSSLEWGTHCSDWSGRDLNSEGLFGHQNNPTKDSKTMSYESYKYPINRFCRLHVSGHARSEDLLSTKLFSRLCQSCSAKQALSRLNHRPKCKYSTPSCQTYASCKNCRQVHKQLHSKEM